MLSVFHKAAAQRGYRVYNATGHAGRILKGWRWIREGETRGSKHVYGDELEAFMGCCRSRDIDVIAMLDDFTKHYLIAALWTEQDSLQGDFDLWNINHKSLHKAWTECQLFQLANSADLAAAYEEYTESGAVHHPDAGSPEACAGHDFWLSRNGHGTGFWDRGLAVGEKLHTAARACGEVHLFAQRQQIYME